MQRWRGVSAMVVLAISAGAQLGRADSREADRLFARGRELMAAGELAEACAAFEVVPTEQWNRAVPVDGGTYAIVARAPGAVEWTTSVSIKVQADQYVVEVPSLAAPPKVTESPASVLDQVTVGAPAPMLPAPGSTAQTAPVPSAPHAQRQPSDVTRPTAPKQRGLFWPAAVGCAALVLGGSAAGVSWWASSTYSDAKAIRLSSSMAPP